MRLIDADVLPEISLFGTTEYINVMKAPTVPAVPLDQIKELRGNISVLREERRTIECHCGCASDIADEVLELIDKLIAEVEGTNETN